jgi:colanic acid biosynthesis protein WcaH
MEVHDEFIPPEEFATVLDRVPQVCVEVVLERDGEVLLAHRTNEPAKGEWFWPGSRVFKGERLDEAARRVSREELGITPSDLERLGVSEHFWERTSVEGLEGRHTVPIVYRVGGVDSLESLELEEQHDEFRVLRSMEPDLTGTSESTSSDSTCFSSRQNRSYRASCERR